MIIAWRIARVAGYMLYCLAAYLPAACRSHVRRIATLERVYVGWAHHVLRVFGARLTVSGRALVPAPGAPRVLLCNHQSQLDIPAVIAALGESAGFVAKKELGRVPLLAWWMRRVGCVFIDRSDKFGARKAMEAAAKSLGTHPLVVFPEGTRSKTGSLLPIKLGGIRMAVQARAHIIPVHIRNTRSAFEARVPSAPDPVPVTLRFFPPLDARTLPDDKESWMKVKGYLEECWAEGEKWNDE